MILGCKNFPLDSSFALCGFLPKCSSESLLLTYKAVLLPSLLNNLSNTLGYCKSLLEEFLLGGFGYLGGKFLTPLLVFGGAKGGGIDLASLLLYILLGLRLAPVKFSHISFAVSIN